MKALPALLGFLLLTSCGGLLPKTPKVRVSQKVLVPYQERIELGFLQERYRLQGQGPKLAITRSLILELEAKYPELKDESLADKKLQIDPRELTSLDLSIEHLAHREAFKRSSRHSAFVAIP